MDINLHVLNASGSLDGFVKDIEEVFPKTIKTIQDLIPIKNVDIVVWEYSEWAILEYGIGGHTMTPHSVVISLDSKNAHINTSFQRNFSLTLMHELHHIARMQALGNDYATRLEVSIREGLAEHFEMELGDKKPEIWDTALSQIQLKKFVEVAKEKKDTDYYSYDWLFGNKEQHIPKWTGYSVGFYLVGEYLKSHPKEKPSSLYNVKAEEFII